MEVQWYRRLADVPNLNYEAPESVDISKLDGRDDTPTLHRFTTFDGKLVESLDWPYVEDGDEGTTSQSPAGRALDADVRQLATKTVRARLWEALELPGTARDYHFAIQSTAGELWTRKRREPEVIEWFEFIAWLDLRLLQVFPGAVRDEFAGERPIERGEFYSVSAFGWLIDLYSREGLLGQAMQVAQLAERFGQGERHVTELNERLEALRAEDAA